jgi:RND family efflux transporter MFP subunit
MKPEVKMFAYSIFGTAVLLIVIFASQLTKQTSSHQAQVVTSPMQGKTIQYYRSTMNPNEVSPMPAKDSMGMEMEPVYSSGKPTNSTISIDPRTQQNMGVRIRQVNVGPLNKRISTVGYVTYDETMLFDINTKFQGWIEKLFVNTTGQYVAKNQPLFTIYSPELYTAQKEYLITINNSASLAENEKVELKKSALKKLKYFDVPQDQIQEIEKTGQKKALTICSPVNGIVVEKKVIQGQMVEAGSPIYVLADISKVWIQAQIFEQDLPFVHLDQKVTLTLPSFPGKKFFGSICFIYPTVDEKTRTVQARIELSNPELTFKPGMYATVEIYSKLKDFAILVPASAVLRSGERNTVFVSLGEGYFEPRKVELGALAANNMYEIVKGLKKGEQVVVSGQFMLDSESQLQEATQKMLKAK